MKRIFTYSIFLICFISSVRGQQDPQFTQWMFDRLSFNPAFAGSGDENCFSFFYRDQWDQLNRDPKTVMLNYHQSVDALHGGVGVTFYNDRLGQEVNNIFRVSYAYQHQFNTGDILSGGIALGYYGKELGDDWIAIDPIDDDPAILSNSQAAGSFDMSLGLYYERPETFYVGASMTHLTGQDLEDLNIELSQHYYFMTGGQLPVGGGDITVKPNALVKGDFSTFTFDINTIVDWNNTLYAGVSYRLQDALAPMAGYIYSFPTKRVTGTNNVLSQSLKIGYSYDATISELSNYSSGSHEIMLSYCFSLDLVPIKKPYGNPRFL